MCAHACVHVRGVSMITIVWECTFECERVRVIYMYIYI